VADSLPLVELAQELRACSAFAGHDSGITHLAAALGIPVLALWGESKQAIWRPLGAQVSILESPDSIAELGVAEVIEQIMGKLD
jgi:ADP-heptose:LPS heptosyltransferase